MKPSVRNPPRNRGCFSRSWEAFCIEKYNISRSGYLSKFHQILRLPQKMTLPLHQILHLPRKVPLMIKPLHTWNASYNAQNNKCHPPTSPNTAPATKNETHAKSSLHMKCYLQCAEQQVSPSNITKYCTCHKKSLSCSNLSTNAMLFTIRGATYVTLQPHQILRLPRKMNPMLNSDHTWNAIYNAQTNLCHPPTSPNTAPATQNDSHDQTSWHMKCYLQCAEQLASPSNLTKYCACHEKWRRKIVQKFSENCWSVIYNARPIREWSDNNPSMKPSVRNPPRNRGYLSRSPPAYCIEKYNISRSGYHSKFHQILRLPRKMTLQDHQILRLPRQMTLMIKPLHTWNAIYNARSNTCHPPISPNTAPATQNDSHDQTSSHMKCYLQCAEQLASPSNLTKYCACHEKWHHKIVKKFSENCWSVIYNARPIREWSENDPTTIRAWNRQSATRLATEVTCHAHRQHFVLKNTTFRGPAIIPNFTKYCACHEKWHSKITKYCACHAKWLSWSNLFTHETLLGNPGFVITSYVSYGS